MNTQRRSPDQYLLDHLAVLEKEMNKGDEISKSLRYHILHKGKFFAGTNSFEVVENYLNSKGEIYTYRINHAA